MKQLLTLVLIGFFIGLAGCASVPREAPALSQALGERIHALEVAHFELLRQQFALQRTRAEEFFEREWIPEYAQRYLDKPQIKEMWEKVNREGTAADKLKFFTIVSGEAQREIAAQRLALLAPLEDAERYIERRLRDEYAQAKGLNVAITGYLTSAAEVKEAQQGMLKIFGVDDKRVAELLDGVESAVTTLNRSESAVTRYEEYRKQIDAVVRKLKEKYSKKED